MSHTLLLWLAALIGLYMAWNIGANDVANAMGTSVGSKALTLLRAIIIAGILEFAGAVLVGAYVTDTVRKGIVDPVMFAGDPQALVLGMIAALGSAALWLNFSSFLGWPVSTTHSIVGAVTGFGLLIGGTAAIQWGKLLTIVASWVVSPVVGGACAAALYLVVRRTVLEQSDPVASALRHRRWFVGLLLFVLSLVLLFKGLKNLDLQLAWYESLGGSLGIALLGIVATSLRRRPSLSRGDLSAMEQVFAPLQVATACSVAFAHGANDVANAVGPLAAVFATIESGQVVSKVGVPLWILVLGGVGIVIGLATYGYRVMATIGTRITEMTPSRGFSAEFGAAITILVGSKLGLPLSTTHTLVGSVIGVGFARGMHALDLRVVRNIVASWLLTVPVAAATCIPLYYLLCWFTGR